MEACDSYKPWHDKRTHRTFLRPDSGKCLHYYFYFIDAELGLIYLRVPTWCPFRLQFYCNGHSCLPRQLAAAGIDFTLADNAFVRIDDWARAQNLRGLNFFSRVEQTLLAALQRPGFNIAGLRRADLLLLAERSPAT